MKLINDRAELRKLQIRVAETGSLFVALIIIGTIFYHNIEGWGYVDSFYFSTITLTTVGYGDIAPKTDSGKLFTSFYVLIGVSVALYVLVLLGQYITESHVTFQKKRGIWKNKNNK